MFCFQFGGAGVGGGGGQFTRHFIADILSEDSGLPPLLSISDQEDPGKMKKQRTSFSGWQIYELERIFEEKKYINTEERSSLSRSVLSRTFLYLSGHHGVYMS